MSTLIVIFKPWDIVKVPFPYIDRPIKKWRPALIIAHPSPDPSLVWVLMITSATNRPWKCDVTISNLLSAGLPSASLIRCVKIATVETRSCQKLGILTLEDRPPVQQALTGWLDPVLAEL